MNFFNLGHPMEHRPFNTQLRCCSAPFLDAADETKVDSLNYGGKIILPPSCLDWLSRLNISYPMMFRLTNVAPERQRATHCGVLDFTADEGRCFVPAWMHRQLLLEENEIVQIQSATLPTATYAKLQPLTPAFLDLTNPRVVLEVELRKYSCLTKNDQFAVKFGSKVLEFVVKDLKPSPAVAITECDMNLDLDEMPGAPQFARPAEAQAAAEEPAGRAERMVPVSGFVPFVGDGVRLDGKAKTEAQMAHDLPAEHTVAWSTLPNNDYVPGDLTFVRGYRRRDLIESEQRQAETNGTSKGAVVVPFSGKGHRLREPRP